MTYIIVKDYEHYSRAFGKYISSKKEYFNEMKKRGMVPHEEGEELAKKAREEKKWKPSEQCINMIRNAKDLADKNGNITLGKHPKLVEAMKKKGVTFDLPDWLPKHYKEDGGYATS